MKILYVFSFVARQISRFSESPPPDLPDHQPPHTPPTMTTAGEFRRHLLLIVFISRSPVSYRRIMKYHHSAAALAALLLFQSSSNVVSSKPQQLAFTSHSFHAASPLAASVVDELPSDTTEDNPETLLSSRNRLVALSSTLSSNSATGRFVTRPADKIKLQRAINELESVSPPMGMKEKDLMVGDWTLVATANVANSDVRRRFGGRNQSSWFGKGRSGLSLFGRDGLSLDSLQKNLRKSIEVTQRIRDTEGNGEINRVDNVIEYTPFETLSEIIPKESPLAFLSEINVNPLKVTKSKVVLVHKAEVESVAPVLRTKIAWTSSVSKYPSCDLLIHLLWPYCL